MTKSGLPPAARAIRSRSSSRAQRGDQLVRPRRRRAARAAARPASCGRRSSSSGRAMQSSRIGAAVERSATCSTRSRKRLLAPLDVVEDDDERRLLCSSSLRNAQAISSAEVPCLDLAEQRPDRGGRGRVVGQRVELLQHLDDRPVGDPLAVGEAAAADDARVDRGQRLRDEPRLADARRRRRP